MEAFIDASCENTRRPGNAGEFDALCRWSAAERALSEYRAKLKRLAELRAEVRRREAEGT